MNQGDLFTTDDEASRAVAEAQATTSSARPVRVLVVEADGGSRGNPGPAGYGALVRQDGEVIAERAAFLGVCSNNVAEYSGLIAGLHAAAEIDPGTQVEVRMDSRLVVEQMSGRWKIKHADMRRLATEAQRILPPHQVSYTWVPRAENHDADALVNQVIDSGGEIANDYRASPSAATPTSAGGPGDEVAPPAAPAMSGPGQDEAAGEELVADLDANAPSRHHEGVVSLVLVSPGMTTHEATADDEDPELSAVGIELASATAFLVDRIGDSLWPTVPVPGLLLTSPMVRAQQVAALLSESTGLGAPTEEPDLAAAGGQEPEQFAARITSLLQRLQQRHAGESLVVAAHADVIAAIAGTVIGLAQTGWPMVRIAPGTISVVRCWPGGGELHVIGCPAQLEG